MPVTELDSAAAAAATGVPWRKEKAGMCSGKTGSGNVGLTADGLLTPGDAAGLWRRDRVDEDQQFCKSRLPGTKVTERLLQGLLLHTYCIPPKYRFVNIILRHADAFLLSWHELINLSW